jgi:DmsE family decaheme c-type cytochrome
VGRSRWTAPDAPVRPSPIKSGFLLAAVFAVTAASGLPAQQQEVQKPAPAPKPAATLIGSETCSACHEDIYKAFLKSPHSAVDKDAKRGWQGNACESCHGPGSIHAESTSAADILNPAKGSAAQADKTCLGCHLNQPTHIGRIQGSHAKNQASCATCHHIHKPGPDALVARRPEAVNKLCSGCHTAQWASFQRPHRHRLPEGAMSCVDCHNPHGSLLPRSIRTASSNEPGCLKCHGDKRGPFAFEHAPVRLEGCSTCHQPHGSANPRMLTRHEVSFQCLECHVNLPLPSAATPAAGLGGIPPAFHDMRSPRFRNCTICHVKVHGSHVSRALLR